MAKDNALVAIRWAMRSDRLTTLWGAKLPTTLNLSQNEYWKVTWKKGNLDGLHEFFSSLAQLSSDGWSLISQQSQY